MDVRNVKIGSVYVAFLAHGRPFRWLGYSAGGPGFDYSVDQSDMFVDQLTTAIMSNITSETLELTFPSVEMTKENIATAFPGAQIHGDRVDIYPASTVNQADRVGLVLVHPVFAGAPVGDTVSLDPPYDSTYDIVFLGSPTPSLSTTFTREDMMHLNVTLRATPDPLGRILVWNDPFTQDFDFEPDDLTGAVGATLTDTLAATSGTPPYSFGVAPMPGWSVDGTTISFKSDKAGVFTVPVYATDAVKDTAMKLITATIS